MRKPKYLSPSSRALFEKDPKGFYLRYLAEKRPPKDKQTQPMSVGSAFDAYTKSDLHHRLFGHFGKNNEFEFETIFEAQVERHNRDWARMAGLRCYEQYKSCGAYADLFSELSKSLGEPRFEISLESVIGVQKDYGGIPILGKPDLIFKNHDGVTVILDWKVNGYCGSGVTSPKPGFLKMRGGPKHNSSHKDCFPQMFRGIIINVAQNLEDLDEDWAAQLATYGWSVGVPIGSEAFVAWIDQLACGNSGSDIRVATHRMKIGEKFQHKVFNSYKILWDAITSAYIFRSMTREENDLYCKTLDNLFQNYKDVQVGSNDEWFNQATSDKKEFWK